MGYIKNYKVSKRCKSVNFFETNSKSVVQINGQTVIKDVVIVQSGIDKAGDLMDDNFIKTLVDAGNAFTTGVKCRGGHPNMCKDSLGTYIGDYFNFNAVEQDGILKATADLYIAEIAKKTMIDGHGISYHDYVVDMAKNHPDKFGNSIVFMASEEWIDMEDKSVPKLTLEKFIASDIVDSPAATDGLFKSDEDLGIKLTEFLDDNPSIFSAIEKNENAISIFFNKYENHLKSKGIAMSKNLKELFASMFGKKKDFDTTDATGQILTVVTDAQEATIGDSVTINGTPAPDGEYTFPDGTKWQITGGKIETITTPQASDTNPQPEQVSQDQVKSLQENINALAEKFDVVAKQVSTIDELAKKVDFIMENVKSEYVPEVVKTEEAHQKQDGGKKRSTVKEFLGK